MKSSMFHLLVMLAVSLPMTGVRANAADDAPKADEAKSVELFQAIDEGLVEVKLTPKNSLKSSLAVTNKTDKPIVVEMPSAFAGVPVLAQPGMMGGRGGMGGMMGGMMGGAAGMMGGGRNQGGFGGGMFGEAGGRGGMNSRGGMGSSSRSGGNQSIGGGMGGRSGGMGGGMGGRGGGGLFSIAPNKTHRESVRTVCLEHGKKEPGPSVEYTIVPIDTYTENKTTQVLCSMLGDPELNQNAVQAAVWNAENGVSFEELASKTKQEGNNNLPESYFLKEELSTGVNLLAKAQERAAVLQEVEDAQKALVEDPLEETDMTVENLTNEVLK